MNPASFSLRRPALCRWRFGGRRGELVLCVARVWGAGHIVGGWPPGSTEWRIADGGRRALPGPGWYGKGGVLEGLRPVGSRIAL